jgi:Protein of unknown function (DUF3750)
MKLFAFLICFTLLLPHMTYAQSTPPKRGWWNADRSSVGIAPKPQDEPRAIVQIYAARAYNWRGWFAVHPWVAIKEKNATAYTVYQVSGWRENVVSIEQGIPDRKWFGNVPEMLFELRGEEAAKMIPHIKKAAKEYPYQKFYRLYPGPNSNSFVAYIIRHTPGIYVEMPPHAIGKDWIDDGRFFAKSETGTGYQFSVYGLLGLTVGLAEGIEVNILGMTFGIDIMRPALKLPFIGRVGLKDRPVFGPKAIPEQEKAEDEKDPMVTPGAI